MWPDLHHNVQLSCSSLVQWPQVLTHQQAEIVTEIQNLV